jgi:hypothetical protein
VLLDDGPHEREPEPGARAAAGAGFAREAVGGDRQEVRLDRTPGVLRLELLPAGYRWSFLTTAGAVRDSGSG